MIWFVIDRSYDWSNEEVQPEMNVLSAFYLTRSIVTYKQQDIKTDEYQDDLSCKQLYIATTRTRDAEWGL